MYGEATTSREKSIKSKATAGWSNPRNKAQSAVQQTVCITTSLGVGPRPNSNIRCVFRTKLILGSQPHCHLGYAHAIVYGEATTSREKSIKSKATAGWSNPRNKAQSAVQQTVCITTSLGVGPRPNSNIRCVFRTKLILGS